MKLITIRNACISLCVQSPSSPSNPSVSVCGIESFVEQLYKIFIEYHLVAEDTADVATIPAVPPCMIAIIIIIIIIIIIFTQSKYH